MALKSTLFAMALTLVPSQSSSAASSRSVFARHDPQDRLSNTVIRKLGNVRVKRSNYSIYSLDFVNPVSLHGQQRIGIIKNGRFFAGAYQCTLGPHDGKLTIGKDRITVRDHGQTFVIHFTEKGPSRNLHFCGESSGWENSI